MADDVDEIVETYLHILNNDTSSLFSQICPLRPRFARNTANQDQRWRYVLAALLLRVVDPDFHFLWHWDLVGGRRLPGKWSVLILFVRLICMSRRYGIR